MSDFELNSFVKLESHTRISGDNPILIDKVTWKYRIVPNGTVVRLLGRHMMSNYRVEYDGKGYITDKRNVVRI